MYTAQSRQENAQTILRLAQTLEDIVAVIAVGSAASDGMDAWSDLDYLLVHTTSRAQAMANMGLRMQSALHPLCCLDMPERGLQVYLLPDFMEIDMGFVSPDAVRATQAHWHVLYDETNRMDARMRASWALACQQCRDTADQTNRSLAQGIAMDAWHYLAHAAYAIRRGQYWRCLGELEVLRSQLLKLYEQRFDLRVKRFRQVDQCPEYALERLRMSFPADLAACPAAVEAMLLAIYDELEQFPNLPCPVTRQALLGHLRDVLYGEALGKR